MECPSLFIIKIHSIKKIYHCSKDELSQTETDVPHAWVGQEGSKNFILAVSRADFDLPFKEVRTPEKILNDLSIEEKTLKSELEDLDSNLDACREHTSSLTDVLSSLKEQKEMNQISI